MKYRINYDGIFGPVQKNFSTKSEAADWLRKIGKKKLIPEIQTILMLRRESNDKVGSGS